MITHILGAPGSGKTALTPLLRDALPSHVVLDWDAFMEPASDLAGRDVRRSPRTWPAYRALVRALVESLGAAPTVVLGVCTPDELAGWPIDRWVLLDCADDERQSRLASRADAPTLERALHDAHSYRDLGLPVIDTTGRTLHETVDELVTFVCATRATRRP